MALSKSVIVPHLHSRDKDTYRRVVKNFVKMCYLCHIITKDVIICNSGSIS